jgi:3(or 17)beta-hydroxysteroid dehydrogenase
MRRVDQQIALVTGGASGLGTAIAQRLAADGARVVITDVQSHLGEPTAAKGGFTFIEQDVCDEGRWSEIVRQVEARFGRLDILVNNAGILGPAAAMNLESTSLADWRRIFAVNVEGMLLGCRAAISAMRRTGGGAIINISSVAGLLAAPHAPAYGASKATVRHLTRTVAQHCAQHKLKIRCNAVYPGVVRTALWERHAEDQARQRGISIEHIVAETKAGIPLGEFTLPEDIAAAVSFLASDDARQVTGAELIVDGGLVSCDTYIMSLVSPVGNTPLSSSTAKNQ